MPWSRLSVMNKFCEYIKIKRAEANLTQEDLASYMEVSLMSVQNWESGRTKIKEDRVSKLAEALHTSEKELLDKLNDSDEDFSNWPAFLFTDEQNDIIGSIRLTPEHKKLLMLLRIYNADNWDRRKNESLSWDVDVVKALRRIPYKYTEEVGVYKVYEMGLHLEKFLKYVPGAFCLDLIREDPDSNFDLRKLEKKNIVKWLDLCAFGTMDDKYNLERAGYKNNLYTRLVMSISRFKESSIQYTNFREFNSRKTTEYGIYSNPMNEYILNIADKNSLTVSIILSEKGKLFQEWCKDIEL